jgi:hypothetical protein
MGPKCHMPWMSAVIQEDLQIKKIISIDSQTITKKISLALIPFFIEKSLLYNL